MTAEGLRFDFERGGGGENKRDPAAQGVETVPPARQNVGFAVDPAADRLGPDGTGPPDVAEGDAAADGFGLDRTCDVFRLDSAGNGLEVHLAARAAEDDAATDGLALDRLGGGGDFHSAAHFIDIEVSADPLDVDVAADVLDPESGLVGDGDDIVHVDVDVAAEQPSFGVFRLDPQNSAFLDDFDPHLVRVLLRSFLGGRLGNLDGVDLDLGLVPAPDLDRSGYVLQGHFPVTVQGFGPGEFFLNPVPGGQISGQEDKAQKDGADSCFFHSGFVHGYSPFPSFFLQRTIPAPDEAVDFFFAVMRLSSNSTLPL